MNIGAVLLVENARGLDLAAVRTLLEERLARVRRMRQRLHRPPVGCGRPFWVDDPAFDLDQHLGATTLMAAESTGHEGCPAELLDLAADLVCRHLPRDRPLWAAQWVTGLADGAALILVVHHAMADGLGGLAVLASLGDEAIESSPAGSGAARPMRTGTAPVAPAPEPPPSIRALAADAWRERARSLRRIPSGLAHLVQGVRELGLDLRRPRLAPATTLNRHTSPRRRLTTVSVPLASVVELAHARGCTVNDVVLTAIVGALSGTLSTRGEHPHELVVSVPISSRRTASADDLGNRTGVVPMTLPTAGPPAARLAAVAAVSRARRQGSRGASAVPMGAAFRLLARLGLFQAFIARQRLVNTFVTNVRGPATALAFGGARVSAVIPIAVNPGNVGVSFDVMSYAGQLGVTVVADPAVVPDQDVLTHRLEDELAQLLDSAQGRGRDVMT